MKKAAKFLLGAAGAGLAAGAGVVVTRALKFRPAPELRADPDVVTVDYDRVVESLREMIRCRTVSSSDPSREDSAEFDKFRAYLLERYPTLAAQCSPERIGRCGVLYTWKGRSSERPTVLMAHYDVVPADGDGWDEPPFDAVLKDGIIWGRGALDTKVTLCAIMEAAEQLISEGFVPANDIYLAFSGEEEPAGPSAGDIVTALAGRGVQPALVLDEGGAVVTGAFPGVKQPVPWSVPPRRVSSAWRWRPRAPEATPPLPRRRPSSASWQRPCAWSTPAPRPSRSRRRSRRCSTRSAATPPSRCAWCWPTSSCSSPCWTSSAS